MSTRDASGGFCGGGLAAKIVAGFVVIAVLGLLGVPIPPPAPLEAVGGLVSTAAPPSLLLMETPPPSPRRVVVVPSSEPRDVLKKGIGRHVLEVSIVSSSPSSVVSDDEDAIPSSLPLLPPPLRVAICFFGLLKSMSPEQVDLYERHLFSPLRRAGYVLSGFLHSFNFTNQTFSNARNGEKNAEFDQSAALSALSQVLPELHSVQLDHAADADEYFGDVRKYLVHGDPWPDNPKVSMKYFLRQQYSLLRVTQLWSNVSFDHPAGPSSAGVLNEPRSLSNRSVLPPRHQLRDAHHHLAVLPSKLSQLEAQWDCVVYLRPDLLLKSPLPIHAVRRLCGGRRGNQIAVPWVQFKGYSDRFAFGHPRAMLLYGIRGLVIDHGVANRLVPHAEEFLARYLCHNRVAVHLVPMYFMRLRATGRSPDATVEQQRKDYQQMMVQWSTWQADATTNKGWISNTAACVPQSVWGEHNGGITA
jgi:hypothetical protein